MSENEFEPIILSQKEINSLTDEEVALKYLKAHVQLLSGSLIDDDNASDVNTTRNNLAEELDERGCWDIVYPEGPETDKHARIEELQEEK